MRWLGLFCLVAIGPLRPLRAATPTAAIDPDTESARRHFSAGRDHYEAGRYADAVNEFEQANRLKPLPELEFNIARTYDRMEQYEPAIEHYEKYLAALPLTAPEVGELQKRVAILRERVAEQKRASGVAPTTPTTVTTTNADGRDPRRPLHKQWWLWTTVGVVVVVGTGLGVGLGLGLRTPHAPATDLGTFKPQFQ